MPYDVNELQLITDEIRSSFSSCCTTVSDHVFSFHEIRAAVNRLRPHKKEGSGDMSSDNFIHAGDDCLQYLALLFSAMIVHGSFPPGFMHSTVVPIPKGHGADASSSSNYRGIALSSILGKIFDSVIMSRYHEQLASSDLQFGFKPKSSTNCCTYVLKEVINHYTFNNSPVFSVFLDISKAFDKVRYCKLFRLLLRRKLPPIILRALLLLYTNNFLRVSWFGVTSNYFLAVNGVKQGAVLSPILFCIYIDELLSSLSKSNCGCHIGCNFIGALAYADDVVLLAPTPSAMRKLLAVCENFASNFSVIFNSSKSKCLIVKPLHYTTPLDCTFTLDNAVIDKVCNF